MSDMTGRWKYALAGIAALALLIGTGVYLFDWNRLREPIAKHVERATGRTFAIRGNFDVRLSRYPRLTAEGLVMEVRAHVHANEVKGEGNECIQKDCKEVSK